MKGLLWGSSTSMYETQVYNEGFRGSVVVKGREVNTRCVRVCEEECCSDALSSLPFYKRNAVHVVVM